jgi:hypothetical protein
VRLGRAKERNALHRLRHRDSRGVSSVGATVDERDAHRHPPTALVSPGSRTSIGTWIVLVVEEDAVRVLAVRAERLTMVAATAITLRQPP